MVQIKSVMKIITTLLLFLSYIRYIESAFGGQARANIASSLFAVFDRTYEEAVSNQVTSRELRSLARRFSLMARTAMPEMELDDNFVLFCSMDPVYDFLKPTAEWIFSSTFVQYSVIQTIFSLTVCRIYNLYALENPNVQQAENCSRVASYLNAFRSIAIEHRTSEIEKIYRIVGDPSSRQAKARLKEKQNEALSMLNMKSRLLKLDDLLDRLTDVIEAEGSQRVPSISCRGKPIEKQKHASPLAMRLDFYVNANMKVKNAPSRALESIESKYMRNRSNKTRDENYRKYYYKEAWCDIFHNFYMDFFPMVNYFDKVLYGYQPHSFAAGNFEHFIPPMDESLTIWAKTQEFRNVIETEYPVPNRSKLIAILNRILMAKIDGYLSPDNFQLSYIKNGNRHEPDFSVGLDVDSDSDSDSEVDVDFNADPGSGVDFDSADSDVDFNSE